MGTYLPVSELQSITCHIRSCSVTCQLTQVNVPCLSFSQVVNFASTGMKPYLLQFFYTNIYCSELEHPQIDEHCDSLLLQCSLLFRGRKNVVYKTCVLQIPCYMWILSNDTVFFFVCNC